MLSFDDRLREARLAMKTGQLQKAVEAYNDLLTAQPNDAQLVFERGLVAQLGNAVQLAVNDYRYALQLDPTHVRARENLGQIARRTTANVGPPHSVADAGVETHPFISAVGASHIRSFSSTTLFLPLWLGPGNELSFLTDDRAARTQAHLLAAIARCDLRNPVMLVLGENDPFVHTGDYFGLKALQAKGELGTDEDIIHQAALRYVATLEAIQAQFPEIKLVVLAGVITFAPDKTALIRLSNRVLEEHCRRLGVVFVDVNDELADPETGMLLPQHSSNPEDGDHGDPHLAKQTVVDVMRKALPAHGLMPTEPMPFEWSFLWQAMLSADFVVRIWGEPHTGPSNLVHSRTVAFNHVLERALHVLLGTLALHPGPSTPSVLVPYCREGFVPLSLPVGGIAHATGLDPDEASIVMARRLAAFFGRPDIAFNRMLANKPLREIVPPHDYVFVALRDEEIPSPQAFLDDLFSVCNRSLVILSTLDWSGLGPPSGQSRMIFPTADAVTRPPWNAGTILIERRS
jgi:hypothetical protein